MRTRLARAWRLARGIHNIEARKKLEAYAEELEGDLQKLEAQAAVAKQAVDESAQSAEPEESITALKPPTDPKTGS